MRPPISIADVLRAYAKLRPRTAESKQQIASLLGFGGMRQLDSKHVPHAPDLLPPAEVPQSEAPFVPTSAPLAHAVQPSKQLGLTVSGPIGHAASTYVDTGDPSLFRKRSGVAPAPFPPLLMPGWTRAILSTALTRSVPLGALDVDVALERLSRAEPLRVVPRLRVTTMAPWIQVLVDVGTGMLPFVEDQRYLLEALRRVAGKSAVESLSYVGAPTHAGSGGPSNWRAFQPVSRAAVLVMGDLGCGRGATDAARPEEWAKFAEMVKQHGSRLVTLVPYPSSRWPRQLARLLQPVHWDRRTPVGRVKASVRA